MYSYKVAHKQLGILLTILVISDAAHGDCVVRLWEKVRVSSPLILNIHFIDFLNNIFVHILLRKEQTRLTYVKMAYEIELDILFM
jgi:hypothetical protein